MAGSKPEWLDRVSDALFLAIGLRWASIPMVQKIQGFPDGWDWLDTTAEQQYRMIGNAVPPALAEAVVTALLGS
jgi:site-specific DNA-cytosine methylase